MAIRRPGRRLQDPLVSPGGGGAKGGATGIGGGRVVTRARTTSKAVRAPKKGYDYAAGRERARQVASERLAVRNKTQKSRAGDKVKVSPASLGSRIKSGNPTPNRGGGLRTTTGQGKKKTSRADVFEAVKGMSSKPGGSSTTTGTGAIRGTAPKPFVRVTTRTSGGKGTVRAEGPTQKTTVKLTKRLEGPSRKGEKPPTISKTVTAYRTPATSRSTEKVNVQAPLKKINPKEKGSAITVRKVAPRKAADVRADKAKANRDRLRNALTIRVNPSRTKSTSKQGSGPNRTDARSEEILQRYYNIRFGDRSAPSARGGAAEPRSIDQRITKGVEERPRQSSRSSNNDYEADRLASRSISALENPKVSAKERIRPGKRTKVAEAVKSGNPRKVAKATANQRKVLEQRQIKEIADRMKAAMEQAAKKGRK